MKKIYFSLLGWFLLLFFACKDFGKDLETAPYEPEFAIPVIEQASITFPDIWQNNIPNQSLEMAPDGALTFKYLSEKAVVNTQSIFGDLIFPLVSSISDTVILLPLNLPGDIEIVEAEVGGGSILFQFQPFNSSINITFSMPQVTKGGQALEVGTNAFAGATLPLSLEGYTIRPNNNELEVRYSAIDHNGVPIKLENAGIFAGPKIKLLKGFWGQQKYTLDPDTIPIDLYDDRFLNGHIQFAQPSITATIESSFGVPLRSQIDVLNARSKSGISLPVQADAIDGIDINYPSLDEIGESKTTLLKLDYTNSNLTEIFESQITHIEYAITAIANPDNDPSIIGFMSDTSTFKAQIAVEIPVLGRTDNFEAREVFDVPFEDINEIGEGEFKLIVENELPLAAQLQFYFKELNGLVIDSLFQGLSLIAEAAPVDEFGSVNGTKETLTFIPINAAQMRNIIQASQLQVKANFQTTGNGRQYVKILGTQKLNFRLGLRFKLN